MMQSELDCISGIGEKSKEALMKRFGSVEEIKSADYEDVTVVVGKKKAKILLDYFLRSTT